MCSLKYMTKRIIDIFFSFLGLVFFSPILLLFIFLIWLEDRSSPFYISDRIGLNYKKFKMIKLRSMIKNADKSGVDSTSASDPRITKIGRFVRRYKIDELTQLFNVLKGDMSLVGPRPNVERETNLYTKEEQLLLSIKPGSTDFSSIIFSDEGEILKPHADADIAYNQLIRPWKSRLGILYIQKKSTFLDIQLVFLTIISMISKQVALHGIVKILKKLRTDKKLISVASRKNRLIPTSPPGSSKIVTHR